MELLASRFCKLKSIKRVELLPYHAMGGAKLKKLGAPQRMEGAHAPSPQTLNVLAEIWSRKGFDAQIGAQR
jgi:pyruvate-formate lyase-activating enzyme